MLSYPWSNSASCAHATDGADTRQRCWNAALTSAALMLYGNEGDAGILAEFHPIVLAALAKRAPDSFSISLAMRLYTRGMLCNICPRLWRFPLSRMPSRVLCEFFTLAPFGYTADRQLNTDFVRLIGGTRTIVRLLCSRAPLSQQSARALFTVLVDIIHSGRRRRFHNASRRSHESESDGLTAFLKLDEDMKRSAIMKLGDLGFPEAMRALCRSGCTGFVSKHPDVKRLCDKTGYTVLKGLLSFFSRLFFFIIIFPLRKITNKQKKCCTT